MMHITSNIKYQTSTFPWCPWCPKTITKYQMQPESLHQIVVLDQWSWSQSNPIVLMLIVIYYRGWGMSRWWFIEGCALFSLVVVLMGQLKRKQSISIGIWLMVDDVHVIDEEGSSFVFIDVMTRGTRLES